MNDLYQTELVRLSGESTTLAAYAGKVLLIVNVASRCGLTPQYEGLEALYRQYGARGLWVLGFPCNQFGAQEPGSAEQIQNFCTTQYQVTFPLFAKGDVNGPNTQPLYRALKGEGPDIEWNFAKFLVGRDGKVVARYDPRVAPLSLTVDIERAL
ncbi:MAG TPA: glutathione peroxidase [Polyangiales bacterium]